MHIHCKGFSIARRSPCPLPERGQPIDRLIAAFRRTSERPQARIEKRPALRGKQGMWTLFGEGGQVLKRGHELAGVLFPLERRLVRLVEA